MVLIQRTPRTDILKPRPTKKAKREEERGMEENMAANLPDDIRGYILSLLPTKHAVATTVLSKKWTKLWTSASFINLELDDRLLLHPKSSMTTSHNHASLFTNFVNHVLGVINLTCIRNSHSFAPNLTIPIS